MNRRINRRNQTPLPPDFAHFLIEEQGLSDRQKKVVYQLRKKTQDSEWQIYARADQLGEATSGAVQEPS